MEEIKKNKFDAIVLSSASEKDAYQTIIDLFKNIDIPDDEMLANLGLFLNSKSLSRILFFYELYKKILDTHGVIFEFGVRWGQTLTILSALRGIFEPFNRHRKIVGFDTFSGFRGMSNKDGDKCKTTDGSFAVSSGHKEFLEHLLSANDSLNPISHLKKFELVEGDAKQTVPDYLKRHPETVISMAILDFDIYEPTKVALECIKPHLMKGSILVFDELCDDIFPGETIAVQEILGLNNLRVKRMPMTSRVSYAVIE
ncbi:class I SAM-dependent methyltransferase [Pseudomonadota bacterium]|nr:class I SAM-dependent methyltransferase [Pseudomonadota bacterium]